MAQRRSSWRVLSLAIAVSAVIPGYRAVSDSGPVQDATNPSTPVKLVFVHHSTGQNWLADGDGGLGVALKNANYFVSDTNYGWGPADQDAGGGTIGDHTDIGNFYSWFAGPNRDTYQAPLLAEYGQHASYTRLGTNPAGANRIVMFKSCFPNSALGGTLSDPVPPIGSNPLRHQSAGTAAHTFANAKGIYLSLLDYFAAHQETLFVLVVSPPLREADTTSGQAALARALSDWLVDGWLASYPYRNVAVFDFYTVLTSNGGSASTNDLGSAVGNHHRFREGAVEHVKSVASDLLAYPTGDSHPAQAGNLKATGEFVPLLNVAYHCWQGTAGCPRTVPATGTFLWPLSPCRLFDSRQASGDDAAAPALEAGENRSLTAAGRCGIPSSARAVAVNVTAVAPALPGNLLLYRSDLAAPPDAISIAFPAGRTRAKGEFVELSHDGSGSLRILNTSAAAVHFVVDATAYFQ